MHRQQSLTDPPAGADNSAGARQEIPDLGPAVFAVVRHNETTGQRIVALHNVTNNQCDIANGDTNTNARGFALGLKEKAIIVNGDRRYIALT